jgi:hypothetical protein
MPMGDGGGAPLAYQMQMSSQARTQQGTAAVQQQPQLSSMLMMGGTPMMDMNGGSWNTSALAQLRALNPMQVGTCHATRLKRNKICG